MQLHLVHLTTQCNLKPFPKALKPWEKDNVLPRLVFHYQKGQKLKTETIDHRKMKEVMGGEK